MISPVSAGGGFTRIGDRHDRGHVVARDRSRRQRELHQPRAPESAGRSGARRVSRVAHSGARDHRPFRRPIGRRRRSRCASGSSSLTRASCPDMGVKVSFLNGACAGGRTRGAAAAAARAEGARSGPRTAARSSSWCTKGASSGGRSRPGPTERRPGGDRLRRHRRRTGGRRGAGDHEGRRQSDGQGA